ncbi:MAG TPA: polysaccharide deacetylase family protein [Blastocatellia bacterium]|nr:polysaccharide deacetylase family protein [Blastocatellia bacterium]
MSIGNAMLLGTTNPVLQALGFGAGDRVVIVHADDLGMCHATLPAFEELIEFGLVTSGSVMVPCPWFLEAAALSNKQPAVDLGIHLTLTSEWPAYRWGPVSTRDPDSGLMDERGFFHRRRQSVVEHAALQAAFVELRAQVETARRAGIDATHLDCHMYTALDTKFLPGYIDLCIEEVLPGVVSRECWEGDVTTAVAGALSRWVEHRFPVFDRISVMGVLEPGFDRVDQARKVFDEFPNGLSCLLIHPAIDTPELRAITPDWSLRVADYQAFLSMELRSHLKHTGIQLIGYGQLRRFMRSRATPSRTS